MSPRPRQATDEAIIQATFRAIARVGPMRRPWPTSRARLACQRRRWSNALVRSGSFCWPPRRPEAAARACCSLGCGNNTARRWRRSSGWRNDGDLGSTPTEIAHTLAFLQIDLTDPDFHRHALATSQDTRDGIRALVKDAIAAGEVRRCHSGSSRLHSRRRSTDRCSIGRSIGRERSWSGYVATY